MSKMGNQKYGFTLIEIVIVIVIVGVLSTLALPRFFKTVEFTRSIEAINVMASARRAADRCSIMSGKAVNYANCTSFSALSMDSPGLIPGTHFCYNEPTFVAGIWTVVAEQNNVDNTGIGAPCQPNGGGTGVGDTITLQLNVSTGTVTLTGTGAFVGIR